MFSDFSRKRDGVSNAVLPRSQRPRLWSFACGCLFLVLGCQTRPEQVDETVASADKLPQAAVELEVLVVDDPPLAQAIGRWRGEWSERTTGDYRVEETTLETLLAADSLTADVVVYAPRYLGQLAEGDMILPLRTEQLQKEGFDVSDVFDAVEHGEMHWGAETYALPFGSPVLMLYYRKDLLAAIDRQPPATWSEYAQLVDVLEQANREGRLGLEKTPWYPTLEPTAEGWGAFTLLARAAPYARHRNYYSTLFELESLAPRITSQAFVAALTEMVEAAKRSGAPPMDPAAIRQAVYRGDCGMAICWPSAAADIEAESAPSIELSELPGSERVVNPRGDSWEERRPREERRVPLVSFGGRVGSVTAWSTDAGTAQRLLAWLTGNELSDQISPESRDTTMFRTQHVASPQRWVEPAMSSATARQYARTLEVALSRRAWLIPPRLPGCDRYLQALDSAVQAALREEVSPEQALGQAAAAWEKITDQVGREEQRAAYTRSLGQEP